MPEDWELPTSDSKFRAVPPAGSCLQPGQSRLLAWRGFSGLRFAEIQGSSRNPKREGPCPGPPQEPHSHRSVRTLAVKLCRSRRVALKSWPGRTGTSGTRSATASSRGTS